MWIAALTVFTMIAFAANSLLCRVALGGELIDPVSFTSLRLVGGAAALGGLLLLADRSPRRKFDGSWGSGAALFLYAAAFSLAYLSLDTGIGALILFGSVQATMLTAGLMLGERLRPQQWVGLLAASGGLIYLVSPGITAPDPLGASLMALSGVSWGVYSIRGRNAVAPLAATSGNFLRTVPMVVLVAAVAAPSLQASGTGAILALFSGAITSGFGYVLWYRALRVLSTTVAAIVQLSVPILAGLGGVIFLGELVSERLVVATVLVLGGLAAACLKSSRVPNFEASQRLPRKSPLPIETGTDLR